MWLQPRAKSFLVILNTRGQLVEAGECVRPQKVKHGRVKYCALWSPEQSTLADAVAAELNLTTAPGFDHQWTRVFALPDGGSLYISAARHKGEPLVIEDTGRVVAKDGLSEWLLPSVVSFTHLAACSEH